MFMKSFFSFVNLIFQTYISGEKFSLNLEKKNPAGYFKVEDWKNQVQIDRRFDPIKKPRICRFGCKGDKSFPVAKILASPVLKF